MPAVQEKTHIGKSCRQRKTCGGFRATSSQIAIASGSHTIFSGSFFSEPATEVLEFAGLTCRTPARTELSGVVPTAESENVKSRQKHNRVHSFQPAAKVCLCPVASLPLFSNHSSPNSEADGARQRVFRTSCRNSQMHPVRTRNLFLVKEQMGLFQAANYDTLKITDQVPLDNPVRQLILGSMMCIDLVLKEH